MKQTISTIFLYSILSVVLSTTLVSCSYVKRDKGAGMKAPGLFKEGLSKDSLKDSFSEGGVEWKSFEELARNKNWLEIFHDKTLDELRAALSANNQNIKQAQANCQEASAQAEKARIALFPNLNATGGTSIGKVGAISKKATQKNAGISGSWDIDLWGNVSSSVKYSAEYLDAQKALLDNVILTQEASLASYYFELKTAVRDQFILDKIVKLNQELLDCKRARINAGVDNESSFLAQAQILEAAKNAASSNQIALAQYEHAIATLVGKFPSEFRVAESGLAELVRAELGSKGPGSESGLAPLRFRGCASRNIKAKNKSYLKPLKLSLPESLSSSVMQARPDIVASQKQVILASININIQRTSFFPVLSLVSSGEYQSLSSKTLIASPNLLWSLGLSASYGLTNMAGYKSTMKEAVSAYEAAVAGYKQTILNAFQEAEDNIISFKELSKQARAQEKNLFMAMQNLEIASNQYKAGIIDKSELISAKISYLNYEKLYNDAEVSRVSSYIKLMQSLGGRWTVGADS